MKIISFDGFDFAANGYWVGIPGETAHGQWTVLPTILPRRDAEGVLVGGTISERVIPVEIGTTATGSSAATELLQLLGQLNPANTTPRTLVVNLDADGDGTFETAASCEAIVTFSGGLIDEDVNVLPVTFLTTSPFWRAQTTTTAGPTQFTANGNLAVNNTGLAPVYPTFTIIPLTNTGRSGNETALIGWKYRAPVVVTNNSDEDWHEVLISVWWGDTTGLTTAKAKADGSDVRVWSETGQTIRRQLLNWDTLATMLVFPVTIPAGASATYWVVYGNPQASTVEATDPEYLDLQTASGDRPSYAACDLYATTGATTAASTTTVVTVSPDPGWEVDRLAGGWAWVVAGTGAGNTAIRRIVANTSNTFTVDDAYETAPTASTVAIWMSGIAMEGVVPTSTTATTVTDSSKAWGTDQWEHGTAYVESGTGAGQTREILSNTGTTITTAAWTTTPDTTSRIRLIKPGYQSYMVNRDVFGTLWRGLWRADDYHATPRVEYGDTVPAGWIPFARYVNEDNYAQAAADNYGSGGGFTENWFTNGRIRRQVRQDRHYGNHKQADGFRLYDPRGIDGVRFDYQWKNVNGIGAFTMAVQRAGSTVYSDLVTNSTTQASLTDVAVQHVNLTSYAPTEVAFNVGPADGVLIPNDTAFTDEAEWRTKDLFQLWINPATIGGRDATYGWTAVGTEVEGYDVNTRLALSGRIVQLGGAGRHHLVPLGKDLVVRVDPDTDLPWCAIYEPVAPTAPLGTDAFTAADGTALETYDADWVKHSASSTGSLTIDNNRVHAPNSSGTWIYYRSDWTPASADYDVAADVVMRSDNNASIAGVAGRVDTAANTYYFAVYDTATNNWRFGRVVAGSETILGSSGLTPTVDQPYRLVLSMRGSLIRVFRDGVRIFSAIDTSITAAGRAGIRASAAATSTTGVHLDNWTAYQGGSPTLAEWTGHAVRFLETATDLEGASQEVVATKLLTLPVGSANVAVSETAIGTIAVKAEWTAAFLG